MAPVDRPLSRMPRPESIPDHSCWNHGGDGAHADCADQTNHDLLPRLLRWQGPGADRRPLARLRRGIHLSAAGAYAERVRGSARSALGILLGVLSAAGRAKAHRRHCVPGHGALRRAAVALGDSWPAARMWWRQPAGADSTLGGVDSRVRPALRPANGT